MREDHDPGAKIPFHEELGAVIFEPPMSAQEVEQKRRDNEQREFIQHQTRTNKSQVILSGLLVLATFCTILVGIWQAYLSKESADAAKVSAEAAKSAANTAQATLTEIQNNEVASNTQFREQLNRLDDSIQQARRMANATERANANVTAADRPWISDTIQVTDFEVDRAPHALCLAQNTGKRPAQVLVNACLTSISPSPPINPTWNIDGAPSVSILVPGQIEQSSTTVLKPNNPPFMLDGKLTQITMDSLKQYRFVLYIFMKTEYIDVQTKTHHSTRACLHYVPELSGSPLKGWGNCDFYNDAD